MSGLPISARIYLMTIWLVAASLLSLVMVHIDSFERNFFFLSVWTLVFVVADSFEIRYVVNESNITTMTIVDAPTIALVGLCGPTGVIAIAVGSLVVDIRSKRSWFKCLFNAAQRSITFIMMALLYVTLMPPSPIPFLGWQGLIIFFAIAAIYYTLNTLFVSVIVALVSKQPVLRIYQDSLRTVQWVHFMTMPVGVILAVLWHINPWFLGPALVPLFMARRSFKAVADWQAESSRNKVLAQSAQQLARTLEQLQDSATAMIAAAEPLPLLETVSARLATLFNAAGHWVILLDEATPRVAITGNVASDQTWNAEAYTAVLQTGAITQIDADTIASFVPGGKAHWQTLIVLPLVSEQRLLGGICLAMTEPLSLTADDRRALQAFAAQAALTLERAQLFAERNARQDELIRTSKLAALGTFAAGISHEFNNLLASILGFAQLGLDSDLVADKNEALEVALRACERGRSITGALLTFARRRDGEHALYLMEDVIEETLTLVEREFAKEHVTIERRIQTVGPLLGDPGQISQVLLNLLINARDAMREKQGGHIIVGLSQQAGEVELVVSDTGCGVPEALGDQIFQPFVTTKGPRNGSLTPGTGLGLSISYGIIENHGGSINMSSSVGIGTTMTIRLPAQVAASAVVPHEEHALFDDAPFVPRRILIVDDEVDVAEALGRMLLRRGHYAHIVANGFEAFTECQMQPYDLVIADMIMPGMSGAELAQHLHALAPEMPIVIMTGNIDLDDLHPTTTLQISDIVYKPFDGVAVVQLIEQRIQHQHAALRTKEYPIR